MPVYTIRSNGHTMKIRAPNEAAAVAAARDYKAPEARPVFDPVGDFTRAVRPALDEVADNIKEGGGGDSALRLLSLAAAGIQGATTNQITGPLSRSAAKLPIDTYERPAAPWSDRFGKAPRKLEGDAKAEAIEADINTALMGLRPTPGRPGRPIPAPVERQSAARIRAARAVQSAMDRDAASGVLPNAAPGALPIHQGGDNLTAMADVLANSPGPGRPRIRQGIRDYEARAVDRTKADIARDLGGRGDYFETLDSMAAARKSDADTVMREIEMQPVALDENSVAALRSDLATSAIRDRARNALANPDADVRASGATLNRLADDLLDNPGAASITLRDAQDISRALNQQATAAYRAGDGGRGEALSSLAKAIRSNAADPERGGVSGYAEWLKQYGDDLAREEALQLGRDVFKSGSNSEQLASRVGEMSEAERILYQKGVGEALLDRVRGTRGDVGALRDLLRSEEYGDRVALAFPDDQSFANFMDSAARRVAERDVNNRIMGGSPTDPRQAARADLEAEGGVDLAGIAGDVLTGNVRGLASRGARGALRSIPRRSRSVIGDPEANLAASEAMVDPDAMTALLNELNAVRARRARWNAIAQRASAPLLVGDAAVREGRTGGEVDR